MLAKWNLIEPFVSVGYVSNVSADILTLSALTSDGSSGSAVLDQQGRVVAIAFASLTQVAGGSLAVPARWALDLIEMYDKFHIEHRATIRSIDLVDVDVPCHDRPDESGTARRRHPAHPR